MDAGIDAESLESLNIAKDLILDVSQGIERGSFGNYLATVTTSNKSYMFGHDRVVLPCELLQVYGWPCPARRIPNLSTTGLLDLVAECMPLQAVAVPLMALVLAMGDRLPGLYANRCDDSLQRTGNGSVASRGGQDFNACEHRSCHC